MKAMPCWTCWWAPEASREYRTCCPETEKFHNYVNAWKLTLSHMLLGLIVSKKTYLMMSNKKVNNLDKEVKYIDHHIYGKNMCSHMWTKAEIVCMLNMGVFRGFPGSNPPNESVSVINAYNYSKLNGKSPKQFVQAKSLNKYHFMVLSIILP